MILGKNKWKILPFTVYCHIYIWGLTSSKFKERWANHKKSINHKKYGKETTLSKKIWELKEMGQDFELKWKILERAQPFSPVSGVCGLCTQEKWYILFKPELSTLNRREEILGHCFHKEPALLKNSWNPNNIPRDLKNLTTHCHF